MILDFLDVFILKMIWEEKEVTTWQITSKYFNYDLKALGKTRAEKRLFNARHQMIKKRLFNKLSRHNIISVTKTDSSNPLSKNIYTLIQKNIILQKNHRFPNNHLAKAICLRLDDKWEVFEID